MKLQGFEYKEKLIKEEDFAGISMYSIGFNYHKVIISEGVYYYRGFNIKYCLYDSIRTKHRTSDKYVDNNNRFESSFEINKTYFKTLEEVKNAVDKMQTIFRTKKFPTDVKIEDLIVPKRRIAGGRDIFSGIKDEFDYIEWLIIDNETKKDAENNIAYFKNIFKEKECIDILCAYWYHKVKDKN